MTAHSLFICLFLSPKSDLCREYTFSSEQLLSTVICSPLEPAFAATDIGIQENNKIGSRFQDSWYAHIFHVIYSEQNLNNNLQQFHSFHPMANHSLQSVSWIIYLLPCNRSIAVSVQRTGPEFKIDLHSKFIVIPLK